MRSRFMLLPLAACLVFAAVDEADARAGKGFKSLFGGSSSSGKASPSSSATNSPSPNRGGENGSRAASSFPVYGMVGGYRAHSAYQSKDSRSEPSSPAAAAAPIVAAPAPVVAGLTPAAPPAAAKPPAAEARPRAATKNYRDPNSADVCPPPAYVFDELNGCRPKGTRVSNLR